MTHPHDAVRVQPVLIDAEGQIEVFGLRYWSEESTKFSLRAVTLCVAHTPHQRAAVLSLKGELLCHVELVDDGGRYRGGCAGINRSRAGRDADRSH